MTTFPEWAWRFQKVADDGFADAVLVGVAHQHHERYCA